MKKRLISLIMVMVMVLSFVPAVHAAKVIDSGKCGDNLTWTLNDDGTLTISGTGDMEFQSWFAPWYESRDLIKSVIICDGVTSIGEAAFTHCRSLASITIPDSVTSIGSNALHYCDILTSITIPNSVTSIGNNAFENCSGLKSITIPNGVISIDSCTFRGCRNLKEVIIPDSVINIGDEAFDYCDSITNIVLPDSVVNIGEGAFSWCFSLSYIKLSENLANISEYLFDGCYNLRCITIPKKVEKIGSYAFNDCYNLLGVKLLGSVSTIDEGAFNACKRMKEVCYGGSIEQYNEIAIAEFNDYFKAATIYTKTNWESADYEFEFKNGVIRKYLGNRVFVNIPPKINNIDVLEIGDFAFYCTSVCDVSLPIGLQVIGDSAFYETSLTHIDMPDTITTIKQDAFKYSRISNVVFSSNITNIASNVFESCDILTNINLPHNVTTISPDAFNGCSSLYSIEIPASIKQIGYYAFHSCYELEIVKFNSTKNVWDKVQIENGNDYLINATIHFNSTNYTTAQRPHIWLNSNSTDGTYLGLGNTYQSGLQVYPLSSYPENVVWHSTNPAVASVSQNGLITGKLEGYANIYVTTPDGVTSDAMKVVVTDLSKFNTGITATDKVSSIGHGSNYEWIINNKNSLYWHAWLNNDSNAGKYYFQNYLCAPLFDMGEIKNLYSGICSVQRAKEILLSFVSDTYDQTFSSVKTELSYKIGKKAAGLLAAEMNKIVDKDYGARLDALGEKNIIIAFENNSYEGGIQTLAEYFEPENPESVAYLMRQCLSAEAISDCFSGLSKVIDFKNTVATIGNEVINVEIAAQTNEAYCDMLDYLTSNCIDSNVRRAAREIKAEMSRYTAQNIVWLASQAIALKSLDETTDWVFDKAFRAITGGSCIAKLGADMGIFVSNELMHADDTLKCADNMRLISYISVAMTSRISDIHLRFISETDPVLKENYAKELIEQYNILISARKLGEENYYNAYKYNPFNFVGIKELFGLGDVKYEQWYSDTMTWLDMAKNNPEKAKPTRQNADYEIPSSASLAEASDIAADGTPYTADEFYGLFADKGLADAVVYSLGTDSENPDWDIVTHEAVEQLEVLQSEGTITDISGISALQGLKYLDLSNQNIHTIPDEITELKNLKGINLFNNGITEYPYTLNDVPSLENVGMGYNLLTEYPDIPEGIVLDVTGNLLNPDEYLAQRYLYCEMPIIYDTSANLYEMIDLKDMYGIIYDYNGADLFADGVEAGEAIYSDSITVSVSNSSNPNANIMLLVDESDNTPYTEERFIEAFPDEAIRAAVLSELGMSEADYEKITDIRLAEISELSAEAVSNMTGINLLKGLNTLTLEGATFTKLPSQLSLLSNLQTLSLRKSKLNSLEGIENIKELNNLNISECPGLEDITAIKDIEGLESLYADGLGLSDILSVIEAMPSITALSVSGNCIEDIDVLLNRQFDYLNISGNYLDIDDLENSYAIELMSNCRKLVYSPQVEGLVKDISFTENNTVSVTLENTTKTNFNNFTLITAIYQNGAVTDVKQTEVEKLKIDEITSIDVGLSEAVHGDTIKCFVWDNLNSMMPLCREYTRTIER